MPHKRWLSLVALLGLGTYSVKAQTCLPLPGPVDFPPALQCKDSTPVGTRTKGVKFIVIHTTEGSTLSGALQTLLSNSQASVHYVVSGDGTITQMVNESTVA